MNPHRSLALISRRTFLTSALAVGAASAIAACGQSPSAAPTQAATVAPATSAPAAQPTPPAAPTATSAAAAIQPTATAPATTAAQPTATAVPSGAAKSNLTGSIVVSYPDQLGKKPPFVDKAAQDVQTANSGAKVTVDLQKIDEDNFYTKLLLALNSGSGPDVFHVSGSSIGELADANYLQPLDDYLKAWTDWHFYPPSVGASVTYKGKIWAIPYGMDTRFFYFRRDIMEKSGLPTDWQPKNVAGILEAAKTIQSKTPSVIPYALYAGKAGAGGTSDHSFVPLVWAYGGDVVDKGGKWIGNSPAIAKAFKYYADAFVTDKLVPSQVLTTTSPWVAMRQKLGEGSLAMLFEGGWVEGGWLSKDKAGTEKNVGYLLFPTETGGPSFTIGGPGTCWFINAQSKSKDLAWEFIKTWNNKDTVAQLNIGDPHPVARTDSAEVAGFKSNKFLVDSTESLKQARFVPPDPNYGKVQVVIQDITGRVATGEIKPEEAGARYLDGLKRAIGDDKVTSQV